MILKDCFFLFISKKNLNLVYACLILSISVHYFSIICFWNGALRIWEARLDFLNVGVVGNHLLAIGQNNRNWDEGSIQRLSDSQNRATLIILKPPISPIALLEGSSPYFFISRISLQLNFERTFYVGL